MVFKLLRLYLRETWNSRTVSFLVLMLALTALLLADLPLTSQSDDKSIIFDPVRLSVVDEDESVISYALVDQFSSLEVVDKVYVESLDEALARIENNETLLALVIPQNFYEQTVQGAERAGLTVYLNEKMPSEATIFVRLLNNATGSVEAIQSALFTYQDNIRPLYSDDNEYWEAANIAGMNMAFKLLGRKSLLKVNESARLNTTWFVISALSCLLAMLTSLLVLLQVQQERRSGMHERLKLANVPWWQLMLAKQLIGLLWLAAGFAPLLAALNRLYAGLNPWPVILAIVLLYWISSSLCLILGYLGRPGETMLLAAWLGVLGILLLGGCIYPWQLLPDWLQQAALISPARWGFTLIYDSLAGKAISATALAALAAMIAASAAGSWLSWRQARPGN